MRAHLTPRHLVRWLLLGLVLVAVVLHPLWLAAAGDNTTVKVDADGQVGGTVAGVGQRMLGGVAKMLMNQFFDCMRKQL